MTWNRLFGCLPVVLALGALTACSSDGAAGSSARATFVGVVTGFGSLYVNGVEFNTDHATYRIDDVDRTGNPALAIGMKVKVRGTINADGVTGTADSVFYDDDVAGPVDANSVTAVNATTKTFTIFGLMVSASAIRTVFDTGTSFASLAEGQNVKVSGYFDGQQIVATRLERQTPDDGFELKGTVSSYNGNTLALTLQNGVSAGPFDVSASAVLDIPADPTGLFVEVTLTNQNGGRVVSRIENEEEEAVGEGAYVSIRGIVSDDGGGGLAINGVRFITTDGTRHKPASLKGTVSAGMETTVTGRARGGVLIAEQIKTEDGDIELRGRVVDVAFTNAKNGSLTLELGNTQRLAVLTDNSGPFVDASSSDANGDASFKLDELVPGADFVEVGAYRNDTAQLVATRIRREGAGQGQEIRLKGPVQTFNATASVTVLGVTYATDSGTNYRLNDAAISSSNFFGSLNINDVVQARDVDADGVAETLTRYDRASSPDPDPVPDTGLAGISVSFKLDPRLTRSSYMGDRWVSPPTYTQVQEEGKALTVDARAHGVAANGGQPIISPQWTAADPQMLAVSPQQGAQVRITVLRIGQSNLNVSTGGTSKQLVVKAVMHLNNAMRVEIRQ